MAVVRAQSSPPYALIVFVFLTVISAGVAIWLAVGKGDREKKTADAEARLARVEKPADRAFVEKLLQGSKNESAMSVAQKQINQLKGVIEEGDKSVETVALDATSALEATGRKDAKLVSAVNDLNMQLKQTSAAAAALRTQVKTLEDQGAQTSQTSATSLATLQKTVDDLKAQLTAATAASAQERKEKEDQAQAAQAAYTTAKEEWEKVRIPLVLQLQQKEQEIKKLEDDLQQIKQLIRRQQAPSVALAPAGVIVRAQPGSDECYINLGAKDHVTVGLRFSVHDPRLGVHIVDEANPNADAEAAGKGGIEVMEVGAVESLCRITRTMSGQHVQSGDLIANPVFQNSKDHKNHFVVIGDFDLDGDGVATPAERDRVLHMITSWGGVIDTELTSQTDYLVAGARPAAPATKGDDSAGSATSQRAGQQTDYDGTIVEAKRSSVPILNANRFLALVGYYNNSIVR